MTWLTRVPSTYKVAKTWLKKPDKSIDWISIDAHDKLYVFEIFHEGIAQRLALVDSEKGRKIRTGV